MASVPKKRVGVWIALAAFWGLVLAGLFVGIGATAGPGRALGVNVVVVWAAVFVLGSILTAAFGYYVHGFPSDAGSYNSTDAR